MKVVLFILFSGLVFSQCKKDAVKDEISPSVVIRTPADGATFTAGQDITVTATVTENVALEEVHFHVTNKSNNEEIVHEHYHPGDKNYEFTGHFTIQSGITYHVEVEAEDKTGNAAEDEIDVTGE